MHQQQNYKAVKPQLTNTANGGGGGLVYQNGNAGYIDYTVAYPTTNGYTNNAYLNDSSLHVNHPNVAQYRNPDAISLYSVHRF